jgi:hypothetical protein
MTPRSCSVAECGGKVLARGLCDKHYRRWRRHGDPNIYRPNATRGCSIPGCDAAHYGRSWCKVHWRRFHRTVDTRRQATTPTACTDCHTLMRPARRPDLLGKPHAAHGLCATCYQRRRRPRHRRVVADVVEDYQFLRASGETFNRAAERLGYTPAALRVALRRRRVSQARAPAGM